MIYPSLKSLSSGDAALETRYGAKLPHWTADGATYFVTFRLADSLPQPLIAAYKRERDRLLRAYRGSKQVQDNSFFTAGNLQALRELFSEKIERYLNSGVGACWMNRPAIADLVENALLFFHDKRYQLNAWAVMPNHVHVVFCPLQSFHLSNILHSWKSFTSKEANKLLGRTGEFWESESYDHLVRNAADLQHCIRYTLDNPIVAGLNNWRWAGVPSEHRRDADAT